MTIMFYTILQVRLGYNAYALFTMIRRVGDVHTLSVLLSVVRTADNWRMFFLLSLCCLCNHKGTNGERLNGE